MKITFDLNEPWQVNTAKLDWLLKAFGYDGEGVYLKNEERDLIIKTLLEDHLKRRYGVEE